MREKHLFKFATMLIAVLMCLAMIMSCSKDDDDKSVKSGENNDNKVELMVAGHSYPATRTALLLAQPILFLIMVQALLREGASPRRLHTPTKPMENSLSPFQIATTL